MNDKELLELAAKAAGIEYHDYGLAWFNTYWNPINDDGDALRLAVKLRINIEIGTDANVWTYEDDRRLNEVIGVQYGDDPYAATRRAIVRAAAEIGRNMK